MSYALNVAVSIPMAVVFYMLTEKIIINMTEDNKYNDKIQKGFVVGFVIGLLYVVLGMAVFNENGPLDNHSIQLALYMSGTFLVLNYVVFSWDDLDEGTKIIILTILISISVIYSYRNKRSYKKKKSKK